MGHGTSGQDLYNYDRKRFFPSMSYHSFQLMIYGTRQTITRVVDLSLPLRHPQQTRHYLSTTSVPHIPSSPSSRTASHSRKHGEQVISASYNRVVSLMGIGRKRSRGDAELDERYLCVAWSLWIVLKIFLSRKLSRTSPTAIPAISFTFGIIHVHSHPVPSSIPRANGVVKKICLFVPEQIGERFCRFDSVVCTSFPLLSYLIFTLTPTPADPRITQCIPILLWDRTCLWMITASEVIWWGFGGLLGWKLAQVSSEVAEVWVRLMVGRCDVLQS